jgi:hypothetical protein
MYKMLHVVRTCDGNKHKIYVTRGMSMLLIRLNSSIFE